MSIAPLFTIVTVCRNAESTLARAAQSLADQTYRDFEWVVVDGLSTDNTMAVAESFAAKLRASGVSAECRSEADGGIYDAMNKGIARARGKIIGILNADDWYESDTLARVAEAHESNPDAGIYYGFLRMLLRDGRELQTYRYRYETYLLDLATGIESAGQHPACFVRSEVYQTLGGFDISYSIAADYEFLLRAARHGVVFAAIDHVLSNFARGGASYAISIDDRLEQRWRAQCTHGLLMQREYDARCVRLRRARAYRGFLHSLRSTIARKLG